MNKEIICTVCPRGCRIMVQGDGDKVLSAEGYGCKRGLEYAGTEYAHPVRILTTTVLVDGLENDLLPVRSAQPLPKEKIFQCMDVIRDLRVTLPVKCYDVIVSDICGTGVDIVATKTIA